MPDWFLSTLIFTVIATVLAIALAHANSGRDGRKF